MALSDIFGGWDPSRMLMGGSKDPWNTVYSEAGSGITKAADGSGFAGLNPQGMEGLGKGISGLSEMFTQKGGDQKGGFAPPAAPPPAPDNSAAFAKQLTDSIAATKQSRQAGKAAGNSFADYLKNLSKVG